MSRFCFLDICFVAMIFSSCKSGLKGGQVLNGDSSGVHSNGAYGVGLVDTSKSYFKNGKLASVEVYNRVHLLNGECRYYDSTGAVSEIINFKKGQKDGVYKAFRKNGLINKIAFFFRDKPMGDAYYFDGKGNLKFYNFSNFDNKGMMLCEYDSIGQVVKGGDFDYFFADSLYSRRVIGKVTVDSLLILVSHQPRTSMQLKIENVGQNGSIVNSFELNPSPKVVFCEDSVSVTVSMIRIIATRFDSVALRKKTFIVVRSKIR